MKLIIIYGVPATGKLTIANGVAKNSSFRVFHNHAVIDLLNETIVSKRPSFGNVKFKEFWNVARKMRLDLIKSAVKIGDVKGLILTMAYTGNKNENKFIRDIIKLVGTKNVYFVKLVCDYNELEKRVYSKSRKNYGKLQNKKSLKGWFEKYGDFDFLEVKNLVLDTSKLSAKKCAEKILKYVK